MFDLLSAWESAGLRCLIIGAHALSFYGVTRETADLDLLANRNDRARWELELVQAGYRRFHGSENFAQFTPPTRSAWPVDLMFVREHTFSRMLGESRKITVHGKTFAVPALEHLLALKLHALKYTHPRRTIKDFQDVVELIRSHPADLPIGSERMRALFERYGTLEWHEKVQKACE